MLVKSINPKSGYVKIFFKNNDDVINNYHTPNSYKNC